MDLKVEHNVHEIVRKNINAGSIKIEVTKKQTTRGPTSEITVGYTGSIKELDQKELKQALDDTHYKIVKYVNMIYNQTISLDLKDDNDE